MAKLTILVVDDTPGLLKLEKAIFESAGYAVFTANNGVEALHTLAVHSIDLIVTDILMPDMDGYLLCYNIRITDRYKNIPIIIYTATYTSKSDQALAMEIGADMFIRKPVGSQTLLDAAKGTLSAPPKNGRKTFTQPETLDVMRKYNARLIQKLEHKVTELEEAREQQQIKEHRFREFFENAPEGITILDLKTLTFIDYNNNALRLLKFTGEELLKKGPVDISVAIQPDGQPSEEKARQYIGQAVAGQKPVFEWTICDAEGKEIITEVRLASLTAFNCPQLLASFVDITERKNAESIREKMTADILQRNKNLEQFAYIVSHNLRAPVANIIGILNLMSVRKLDKKTENEMNGVLLTSTSKLDDVIRDLNYILQVKSTIDEKKELVSFSDLLEDIKTSLAGPISTGNVEITGDFSCVDSILTIKSYLYSIFLNLVSNSIKYRRQDAPSFIEISSITNGNGVTLAFKDNGLGIDLAKRGDQVFGLYKRFHTHVEGKGVGLFMVKTQVESLGGDISVTSEVNKGTVFTIML